MQALEDEQFRAFVQARGPALLRSAYLLTSDQQLAEDLVQSALERVVRHWSRIREPAAAESYVRRTMYREQVSQWRRSKVAEVLKAVITEPRPSAARVDGDAGRVEDRMDLKQALMCLPVRQRMVLVLRYYADLTEYQVAGEMGTSVGTVKSQTAKALDRLRRSYPELDARRRTREADQ